VSRRDANRPAREVSAAEVVRNFGLWQDQALAQPILITHHGRPRVAMVSMDEYHAMDAVGEALTGALNGAGDDLNLAILNQAPFAFVAVDARMLIVGVNSALETLAGVPAVELLDRPWKVDLIHGSPLFSQHLERTARTGEPAEFEFAAGWRAGNVYAARTFPYRDGAAAFIDNRTELRELRELEDRWQAVQTALGLTQGFSIIKLSMRGLIDEADGAFWTLTGFRPSDLATARLADIVAPADRHAMTQAVETVLSSGGQVRQEVRLLTHDMEERRCMIGMAAISHNGVTNGAMATLTTL
jgi:PAS domain-containing protein